MSDISSPVAPPEPSALTAQEPDLFAQAMRAAGRDGDVAAALLALDRDIFLWRRSLMRGEGVAAMLKRAGIALELVEFQALLTVDRLSAGDEPSVTIGAVAQEMGLDPSRASRLATKLIAGGYLRRGVAQSDARKVVLELTPLGDETLTTGRRQKWARYVEIFAAWGDAEIMAFAGLLRRYTATMREIDAGACKSRGESSAHDD